MGEVIRVLIADDHYVIRASLNRILASQDGFQVVGQSSDGESAVEMTKALQPDVVLMDYEMPGKNGVAAIQEIREADPRVLIIGFSMHDEATVGKAMLDAGAAVYISKKKSAAELLPTICKLSGMGNS